MAPGRQRGTPQSGPVPRQVPDEGDVAAAMRATLGRLDCLVLVRQGQRGSLVGVSSTSVIDGLPGQEHYAASKTALLGVMRALAVELARHKVRCNSLLPGWTDTELLTGAKTHEKFVTATTGRTPVRRWGTLHNFETVGAFPADPSLIFHTRGSMVVDGGYTIF